MRGWAKSGKYSNFHLESTIGWTDDSEKIAGRARADILVRQHVFWRLRLADADVGGRRGHPDLDASLEVDRNFFLFYHIFSKGFGQLRPATPPPRAAARREEHVYHIVKLYHMFVESQNNIYLYFHSYFFIETGLFLW